MGQLDRVDLSRTMTRAESERQIERLQLRLLHLRLATAGLLGDCRLGPGLCVVLEGWDAAGKGGAIKRLVGRLDPRHVHVAQFHEPSEVERRHHFLWRFAAHIPARGEMSVFDRSWYGRVLVERVEGMATKREWRRAYEEIVDFERALSVDNVTIVKCWLHISEEEQLRRFETRRDDPLRAWKLTGEDWRNRTQRGPYEHAVNEMLERTSHERAPWEVIPADSKHYARVAVLAVVVQHLEQGMRRAGIEPPASTGADFDRGA